MHQFSCEVCGWGEGILRALYLDWHHIDLNRKFAPILNKHTHPGSHDIDWQQTQVLTWRKQNRRRNSSECVQRVSLLSVGGGHVQDLYMQPPPASHVLSTYINVKSGMRWWLSGLSLQGPCPHWSTGGRGLGKAPPPHPTAHQWSI